MKIKFRSIDEVLNKMNELLNEVATEEAKEATTDNDEGDGAHKIKEVKAATSKKEKRKQKLKAKRMKRQMNKTGIKFSDQLAAAIRIQPARPRRDRSLPRASCRRQWSAT